MSGGIAFKSGESWIAATWVFSSIMDFAREYISKKLYPNLYSVTTWEENPIHFILIEELSKDEERIFYDSLKKGFEDAVKNDGEGFADRTYYLNFIERYKELLEMLPS
ncbi:MAG TPA: hypothetical protein VGC76_18150 [Pyrinomonadaceae bacterium]|jgi:hypothetical protein